MHPRHPQPDLVLKRPGAVLVAPPGQTPTPPPSRRLAPALVLALGAHLLVAMHLASMPEPPRQPPAPATAAVIWASQVEIGDLSDSWPIPPELPNITELPLPPERPVSVPALEPKYEVVPAAVIAITGPSLGNWVIEQAATDPSAADTGAVGGTPATDNRTGQAGTGRGAPGLGDTSGTGGGTGGGTAGLPVFVRRPRPRYPMLARQQGWQGTTLLRVEVRADGRAGAVELVQSSGHEVLDQAAIESVRAARFKSAASAWVEVPITFRLNQG